MIETLKRNWWLGVAALLGALQLAIIVGIWIDKLIAETTNINGVVVELPGEPLLDWGLITLTIVALVATAAIAVGLYSWFRSGDQSRWLIMIGVLPSALIGFVFFWFPPFWIVTGAAIAVFLRASKGEANERVPA